MMTAQRRRSTSVTRRGLRPRAARLSPSLTPRRRPFRSFETRRTQNSIVDVNQSLVDDGLVDKEKIGGSNYFWSFPAKKDRLNQLAHEENRKQIESLKGEVQKAEARLADAKRGREEDEGGERAAKMVRRADLAKALAAAAAELEKLKQNDPREIANLEKELTLVTGAAHRWTDNIFSCKDYLVKKRGMMKKEGEFLGLCSTWRFFPTNDAFQRVKNDNGLTMARPSCSNSQQVFGDHRQFRL